MGSGKTESAITYINEHPNEKFIFITPYLTEAARIKSGCPEAHFIEPSKNIKEFNFKKIDHIKSLLKDGCNIASTHQAFRLYSEEMLEYIREQNYTLIIDENMDMLESNDIQPDDLSILIESGYLVNDDNAYKCSGKEYHGQCFRNILQLFQTRGLVDTSDPEGHTLYFWRLSPELVTSFNKVFILTYLFECHGLHHMLAMNDIPYEYIGVSKKDNIYRFSDSFDYHPPYTSKLLDKVHLLEHPKLNIIGEDKCALSMAWFKQEENIIKLKNNTYNYFNNLTEVNPGERLWGSFNKMKEKLKGKGYSKCFLTFNTRATNDYCDRTTLAYLVNIFMNVPEKLFYLKNGIDVQEDQYALSTMIQWIWRSAIRRGEEIQLYLPSSRMRSLLLDWMEDLQEGKKIYGHLS